MQINWILGIIHRITRWWWFFHVIMPPVPCLSYGRLLDSVHCYSRIRLTAAPVHRPHCHYCVHSPSTYSRLLLYYFFVYSAKALLDAFHASRTLHALQCSVWRLKLSSQTYWTQWVGSLQNRYNSHWPMNTIHLYDPMIYIHITDPDQRSWSDPLVCTAIFIKKVEESAWPLIFSRFKLLRLI